METIIEWVQGFFPYATKPQIIKGICWAILLTANIVFLLYLLLDTTIFTRRLRKKSKDFEKKIEDIVKTFTEAGAESVSKSIKQNRENVSKAIEEGTQRINLLSKENGRLMEERDFLKDKLKSLGFTEEQLKV